MISYAQNLEDVVLARLSQFVERGTYVDVGAGHPVLENVTYWLYTQGWRGINVEPMPREAGLLRALRPEDITVQCAAGASSGLVTLFEAPLENRGATTSDEALVKRYREMGQSFKEFIAPVRTLDDLLREHHSGELHLVKIDVEGAEAAVLAGFDLRTHRPWVLVIEATVPNGQHDASDAWEPLVLDGGYALTLFDGLNRYYVRRDLDNVRSALSVPANVFDRWTLAEVEDLRRQLAEAASREADLERQRTEAERYAVSLHAALTQSTAADSNDVVAKSAERAELAERYAASLLERAERAERFAATLVDRAERAEAYARTLEASRAAKES